VLLLSTRFSELRAYLGGSGSPGLTTGLVSAIFSSVFFGSVYIGIGYAAPFVNFVVPALVLRSVATVVGFALAPVLHHPVRPSRSNLSNTIIVMGLLEAAGFLSFTYAISTVGNALPVVAALSGMGGGVAATYALVFLKERLEWNQFMGVLVSMAGVFTLLYLGA
jgi:drug/metabolite transporter (DMT)-like permease